MTDFYCLAEDTPELDHGIAAFSGISKSSFQNAFLHVPFISIEKYKQEIPLTYFGQIVPLEDESGISDVRISNSGTISIYNLGGQRLVEPKKGINIIDGKKYVIKR